MKKENFIAPGVMKDGVYRVITDWNMVVGARVSEERIQQLMTFDFDSFMDLTLDDIVACNNRKFQVMLWSFGGAAEKVAGEETAFKIYNELGYAIGKKGWESILKHFKTDKLTPAQVAWYQDMAHFFYGPHCSAYTEYTEDAVVVTRQDCMVTMPPKGMEDKCKFVQPFVDGYLQAYRDLSPYLEITFQGFITAEEMNYKVDLQKYPSFCGGKKAGQPFHQLVFQWIE